MREWIGNTVQEEMVFKEIPGPPPEVEEEVQEVPRREKDPFKAYLEEVLDYKLLTHTEELALVRQLQEGRKRISSALHRLPGKVWNFVHIRRRGAFHKATLVRECEERLAQWIKTHQVPGLTPQSMRLILKEIEVGEAMMQEARGKLIQANLRLVISIANRYRGLGLPLLDLIQEGNQGLMRAVERFDPEKGYKFSTYATFWIRQGIRRAISDKARVVRLPIHVAERHQRLARLAHTLAQEKGRRPTSEEIASRASLQPDKVKASFEMAHDTISLQTPVGEEGTELSEFISDRGKLSPLEFVEEEEKRKEVERVLHNLTPREEKVIRLRFGIGERRDHSLEEVGRELSVTRERIRQIERDAIKKLRSGTERERLKTLVA